MYLLIDRKWLEENMDKFEKEYEETTGKKGQILIDTDGVAEAEEWCSKDTTIFAIEYSDHITCSFSVKTEIDIIIKAVKHWVEKLECLKKLIEKEVR